jgi:DNA modification methylase
VGAAAEYEGKVDLIYADPPFFSNRRYSARVGRGEDSRKPAEWKLAEGYPDHWTDLDAYLDMLYPRLALMHRLLKPTGTLYLHLDWHADAYARLLLDEIFGADRLLNQIAWVYRGPSPIRSAFNRKHDTILVYTKSAEYTFNADAVRQAYDPSTVKTFASSRKAGFGKVPTWARQGAGGLVVFPVVARLHSERTGYPTQKPEALLERVILASSNPGELVADFFCGSGTTAVAAAKLGRRFLASDISWRAVHTARTRLVRGVAAPFSLQAESAQAQTWKQALFMAHGAEAHTAGRSRLEASCWTRNIGKPDPTGTGCCSGAAQAARPLRNGGVPGELRVEAKGKVCARVVDCGGNAEELQIVPEGTQGIADC